MDSVMNRQWIHLDTGEKMTFFMFFMCVKVVIVWPSVKFEKKLFEKKKKNMMFIHHKVIPLNCHCEKTNVLFITKAILTLCLVLNTPPPIWHFKNKMDTHHIAV